MTLVYRAHRSSSTSLSTASAPKRSRQSKTHRLGKHLTQAIFKTTEKRSARMECEQTITGYAGHYSLFPLCLFQQPPCAKQCRRACALSMERILGNVPKSVHRLPPKTLRHSRCSRLDTAQRSSSSSSSTAGTAYACGGHKKLRGQASATLTH